MNQDKDFFQKAYELMGIVKYLFLVFGMVVWLFPMLFVIYKLILLIPLLVSGSPLFSGYDLPIFILGIILIIFFFYRFVENKIRGRYIKNTEKFVEMTEIYLKTKEYEEIEKMIEERRNFYK